MSGNSADGVAAWGERRVTPRLSFIRATGIVGVDIARYWMIAVLLWLMVVFIVVDPIDMISDDTLYGFLIKSYHGLCGLLCFVVGLAIAADDRERETVWLLRSMPVRPGKLVLSKLGAALVIFVGFIALCDVFIWGLRVISWNRLLLLQDGKGLFLTPTLGSYHLPSLWQFGVWWPLSIAQILALIMVGLGAGSAVKNFVLAAVLGLAVYAGWYTLWIIGFRGLERTNHVRTFHVIMTLQQLALALAAGWVYCRSVRWQDAWGFGGVPERGDAADTSESASGRMGMMWNRLPGMRSIHGRFVWVSVVVIVAHQVAGGVLPIFHLKGTEGNLIVSGLFVVSSAIIGAGVLSKSELQNFESLLYWQPVSRWKLLLPRLALAVPFLMFWPVLMGLLNTPEKGIAWTTAALSAGFTTVLFRFFFRNALFAIIIAGVVVFLPMGALVAGLDGFLHPQMSVQDFGYLLRWGTVLVVAPLVAVYLAYCKSPLLSLTGTTRVWAGMSAAITYVGVLGLLLTTNFTQVGWLVMNWLMGNAGGWK